MKPGNLDQALFKLLQRNARMSMADIARALGVSRATAGKRLDRLMRDGTLRLLAETDLIAADRGLLTVIGVKVENHAVAQVARELAAMPETLAVTTVHGRYDIEAVVAVGDQAVLAELLTETIPAISGISERSPSLCLEVIKFESNRVPFLS